MSPDSPFAVRGRRAGARRFVPAAATLATIVTGLLITAKTPATASAATPAPAAASGLTAAGQSGGPTPVTGRRRGAPRDARAEERGPETARGTGTPADGVMLIDGDFSDWTDIEPVLVDPADARTAELDIRAIRVAADGQWITFMVELTNVVTLQALDGRLLLTLDTDGEASTGRTVNGMEGADIEIAFTPPDRRRPDRPGRGVGIVAATQPDAGVLGPDALDLSYGPTYASDRFEIRMARDAVIDGRGPFFRTERVRGRFVLLDPRGTVRDETAIFSAEIPPLATGAAGAAAPWSVAEALERDPDDLRILSWNAERGVMLREPASTGRILTGVDPDIVLLQELPEETTEAEVTRFFERVTGESWTVRVGRGGGNLRCVVATRLRAVTVPQLDPLPDPQRSDRQVRTAALAVEHRGRAVLATSVHLKCCGRASKPGQPDSSDEQRVRESQAIREATVRAMEDLPIEAVIIAGDLNLVGSRRPIDTLVSGTDVDGSSLAVADAWQLGGARTNATWMDVNQPFAPGRLDYVLYGDRSLVFRRGIVLNGLYFPRDEAGAPIRAEDPNISDHFPIVVDLAWGSGS